MKVSHLRSGGQTRCQKHKKTIQERNEAEKEKEKRIDKVVVRGSELVVNEVRGPYLPNRELSEWMTHIATDKNQEALRTLLGIKGAIRWCPWKMTSQDPTILPASTDGSQDDLFDKLEAQYEENTENLTQGF